VLNLTADAFAHPGGMNEEGSNFCWVKVWVEELVFFKVFAFIAAIKGFAFAPSAATDDLAGTFGDEVGLVLDELSINAKDGS
jgi:hypothetical protein